MAVYAYKFCINMSFITIKKFPIKWSLVVNECKLHYRTHLHLHSESLNSKLSMSMWTTDPSSCLPPTTTTYIKNQPMECMTDDGVGVILDVGKLKEA